MIIKAGRLTEQLCWSELWTGFSARTAAVMVTGRRFGLQHASPWARVNVLTRGRLLPMAPGG